MGGRDLRPAMTIGLKVGVFEGWYCTVRTTSSLAVWETVLAVARVLGLDIKTANTAVDEVLILPGVDVEPVSADARRAAIDAFDRFGKGRHPAALNFGDCFAYASARQAGVPMLYKGDDFARTDIETA